MKSMKVFQLLKLTIDCIAGRGDGSRKSHLKLSYQILHEISSSLVLGVLNCHKCPLSCGVMRPNHLFLPRFHRSNKIGTLWGAVFLESFTNSYNLSQITPSTKVLVFHFHHNLCTSNSWLEDWELTVEVPLEIQGFLHYWRDCPSSTLPHMVNGGSL